MKKIVLSSKDNEKIKVLKKLGAKKYRNKLNKFLVENLAIIHDALKSGVQPESVFLTQSILDDDLPKIKFILENIDLGSVFVMSESVNRYFSNLETASGVAAVYKKENSGSPQQMKFENVILYLNEIKDPGNLGTILRSAVAFDVKDVVLDENCVDLYNPKVVQSAKDAIFKLNISFDKNLNILKDISKKMGVLVTDVDSGEDVSGVFKDKDKFCVVLGSESHGVGDEIKKISNKTVNIKSDSKMESLNVAVSAGIILYEIYNK